MKLFKRRQRQQRNKQEGLDENGRLLKGYRWEKGGKVVKAG